MFDRWNRRTDGQTQMEHSACPKRRQPFVLAIEAEQFKFKLPTQKTFTRPSSPFPYAAAAHTPEGDRVGR